MNALPTTVTTENLETILSTLEGLPTAQVNRIDNDMIVVTATKKNTQTSQTVLRAVTRDGKHWHVMAVDGIIQTKFIATI
jgi:hypothetical protein